MQGGEVMLSLDRRRFLATLGFSSFFYAVPGAFAEELIRTPAQTEGPFYPDKLPLDTDNDLLIVNNAITPRILDARGTPVRRATVEIWQVDGNGVYLHTKSQNSARRDGNFQGFGRFLTGSSGEYLFRTVKPAPYPGRTPHIHFQVSIPGREKFTTQCYIAGHPQNEKDGVFRRIAGQKARQSVSITFDPIQNSRAGELAARFDIVLGFTPET
jgi:protocatechuate 3,4-dioxygenase beta subunit